MNDNRTLCEIGAIWGTDKHDPVHFPPDGDLASFYHGLLQDRRDTTYKVLEIGIGTMAAMAHTGKTYTPGASLLMWETYFPHADIYALDIDPSVLINQGRIISFQCDQGDVAQLHNIRTVLGSRFDFIVDDGSHLPEHQVLTANAFMPLLNLDGIYAIEDIPLQARDFVQKSISYKSEFHEVMDIYGGVGDLVLVIRKSKQ